MQHVCDLIVNNIFLEKKKKLILSAFDEHINNLIIIFNPF